MGNGLGALLDLSRRALSVQSQALRVIGNNISNVNTEGYSRRKAELVSRGSQGGGDDAFGSGVNINRVIRVVDKFLGKELQARISTSASAQAKAEFLNRAQAPFSLDQTVGRIGFQLSEFFSSLEDLEVDPANIPLRGNVIDKGAALTQSIQSTYSTIANLQREADNRMGVLVTEVNQITEQIAELNGLITPVANGEQENIGLLDQREQLVRQLSSLIGVETVQNSDGTILVTLQNGFGLVTGNSARALEFTPAPSFAPVGGYPEGLDGQALGHIVFDFDDTATDSHIDLTGVIASSGGQLGGLANVRGIQSATDTSTFDAEGDLVDIAARVESIARDLLTRFNQTYLGSTDEDTGTAGFQPSSGDLGGTGPGVYGLFTFAGAADSDTDGLPDDLTANGLTSYASEIEFGFSDPADFAAALDLDPADNSTSFVDGDGSNISALLALRDDKINYSLGNFSLSATVEELYDSTVTYVGGVSARAANDYTVAAEQKSQQEELQAAVSGVNIDEELTQLISFQRAFQASAHMIRTGDDLFTEIINLVR